MNHIEVLMPVKNPELQEIIIAQLETIDFEAFEQNDETLKGFISDSRFNEKSLNLILSKFNLTYSQSVIENKNWNELWESDFQPVIVDDFVAIRASFHKPILFVQHELVITPKMSFGTGHHATTYMMIELMKHIDFKGKSVADFGTGTGVLSMLADKSGADFVWAIDNDDWCIANATENSVNNCSENIHIQKVEQFDTNKKFNIVLANINKNIIQDNFKSMSNSLLHNGILVLSGLLKEDEADILAEAEKYKLAHLQTTERKGWIAIKLIKK